jgi:hypothetical protein
MRHPGTGIWGGKTGIIQWYICSTIVTELIGSRHAAMDIHDYLIDQAGKDWPALFEDWGSLFPRRFTLWLVNRFGDAFVVLDDESVHMLNVGIGQIKRVADSRDHFFGSAPTAAAEALVSALFYAGASHISVS